MHNIILYVVDARNFWFNKKKEITLGIKHVPNKGDEARFSYFDQKSVQLSTIPKVVVGTMRFQTHYFEHAYSLPRVC